MTKKYLDANVFIYSLLYDDKKAETCKEIILKIAKKELDCATSLLSWDEVFYVVKKLLGREQAKSIGKKFLNLPNLELVNVDINTVAKAQELISFYNLEPRDAIHAATALTIGASEIISDDSDFDKIRELKRIKID